MLDPGFPQVQSSLGVAYFNAREFEKSEAPLTRALAEQPQDAGLKRMLAIACVNTQAWEKAAALLQDDPGRETDPSLELAYGLALLRSSRSAEAEKVFTGLLTRRGDSAELSLLLGQAQAAQDEARRCGRVSSARGRAQPGGGGGSRGAGRGAREAGPGRGGSRAAGDRRSPRARNPRVHEQLAKAYQELGRTAEAEQQLATFRRLQEKGRARSREAPRRLALCVLAGRGGRGPACVETPARGEAAGGRQAPFDAARRRPQSVKALLALAQEQSGKNDLRGALETLRQARALAPNSEEVLSAYAEASLAVRAPLSAVPVLEALTRMCPSVGQYHYLLGMALVQAGDVAAAVVPLKEAERLEPNEPPILVALGTALNERKLYPEAKPPLLRALSLAPDNVEAMAALAEAEEGLGELTAAEDHAQRALARSGSDATANRVMGMVRMKQERYAEARDALLKAVASDPCSTKAQYQLSLAYARLGDPASAEKHLAQYRRCVAEAESASRAGEGPDRVLDGRDVAVRRVSLLLSLALLGAPGAAQPPGASAPRLLFRDVTREAGIAFVHQAAPEKKYIMESMSGGVALLDFDNDGLLDIYLTNSLTVDTAHDPRSARSVLYRNLGDMKFEDVTDRWAWGTRAGPWACARPTSTGTAGRTSTSPASEATPCIATTRAAPSRTSPRRPASRAAPGRWAAASRTTTGTGTSTSS